jgi:hypothetical protein
MNPSNNQNKKSNGWKILIASISVTSLIGLVNIFSNKDAAKSNTSSSVDALLNLPIPTLVPVSAESGNAAATTLRAVTQPDPTSAPVNQAPVIERVVVGGGS